MQTQTNETRENQIKVYQSIRSNCLVKSRHKRKFLALKHTLQQTVPSC